MSLFIRVMLTSFAASLVGVLPLHGSAVDRSALNLAYSPDGKLLAVVDATANEVVLLDSAEGTIEKRISLDAPPAGLAWEDDSKSLWVSLSGASRIEKRATSGVLQQSLGCGRYPEGLVLVQRDGLLLAADRGMNQLTVINTKDGVIKKQIPVGCQPTAVATTPDESLAVVSALLPSSAANAPDHAAELTIVDLERLTVRASIKLPLGSTAVRGVAIDEDGRFAYVAHVVGRFNLPTTQIDRGWVNTNAVSVIDLEEGRLAGTVLLDEVMRGAADPWGVALHPSRPLLYITLAGVHELAIIQLDAMHRLLEKKGTSLVNDLAALENVQGIERIPISAVGPRGIDVSPDGSMLAIASYFSGEVVITGASGKLIDKLSLGPQAEPSAARRGEMIFHDASDCFQTWLSCATCHPDARADGLNWDLLNDGVGNAKNARSMLWSDRTPPLMTLGVRSDLEATVRAGFTHIQFAQPDSEKVANVVAYLSSLEPSVSPYRNPDGSLTESAERGKKLYHNRSIGCARCHPAPLYTRQRKADVGTSVAMDQGASRFDTPSLVELWRTPPYLHHGQAADIHDVLVKFNPDDKHGRTSQLSESQLSDLIAYLLSL